MAAKGRQGLEEVLTADFYSRYSGLLALSNLSLMIVDLEGRVLYEFIPTPDFCKYVCQSDQGQICPACVEAMHSGAERFVCPNGLVNVLEPVLEDDTPVAYVVGSRVYSHETEYQKYLLDVPTLAQQRQLDAEFVAKTCSMLKTAEPDKIEAHEQLCTYIAQSISRALTHGTKEAPMQSIEKDMLEKKIIDLEAKNTSLMVNPHFLFNTLNCIARIAYFEKAPKTEELIYYLSDLLRYNVQNEQALHTIQAELDNIEKYLYIQKARFQSRLQYSINVPEHIRSCRIPNMVLQPVVENALIHGISRKRDGGQIDIYAENHGEKITIFVVDNGNGFPKEVLKRLKERESPGNSDMGLRITDKRIKQYYGDGYGLEVVKSDYSGSTVSITISKSLIGR
jgi:K+-sensing histidine kinase KdpD